ncbi:MAG TPA: glutamate synthase subunit beta [Acidimicrobiales bacterium]|nr:glutamate synthase subunit beta [Acidimicrobiales bacterium]
MADPDGFLKHKRREAEHRPVHMRVRDWGEMYEPVDLVTLRAQASRCMDCAIPFCNSLSGCPLGNLIPDWNDLVYRDRWRDAIDRLHATNNFPEFTGRMCPAPCESACVLSINDEPVTIKQIENEIINYAWEHGWVTPVRPSAKTGKRVAVVGSGPAGMAAGQQLTRAGHEVVVYERDDRPGGLIRYGIPDFKMDKELLDRRVEQMEAEGTTFECGVDVGVDLSVDELRSSFDAVVLAVGALWQRDLEIPGRHLGGVHLAMEYLVPSNWVQAGLIARPPIDAAGKRVIIIGGGDTGADCLGTAHRQGAASVHQFDIHERPPDDRPETTPWPLWPLVLRDSLAHEEGGKRVFAVRTDAFIGNAEGQVRGLQAHRVRELRRREYEDMPGSEFELDADLVLLAIGFRGPDRQLLDKLGTDLTKRGTIAHDGGWATSVPGVFACGDATKGASLIVWAIAEARAAAAAVDRYLVGETLLPAAL